MNLPLTILLFIPLFFVVNLIAALPGRSSVGEVVRAGVAHFAKGLVITLVATTALWFLIDVFIDRAPLTLW